MPLQEEIEHQGIFLFRYRSFLPLVILLVAFLAHSHSLANHSVSWAHGFFYQFLCLQVCLLGLLIRVTAVGHSPPNTSGRNTADGQVADELNTTGLYSLVRHPLYLGNFFMWLGIAMLSHHVSFVVCFLLVYWLYYERIMLAEEQFLRRKFGGVYVSWARQVPAFLPRSLRFSPNRHPFSWKKVLRQEKNGFAAIFILFFLFELADSYTHIGTAMRPSAFLWFYPMLLGVCTYLVLKFLKKRM